jgi:hypothetical protein
METNDMVEMLENNKKRLLRVRREHLTSEKKIEELTCVLERINEILLKQKKAVD